MILLRIAVLLLTVASYGCVAKICCAPEREQLWLKDWQEFGKSIAPFAKKGAFELHGDFLEFNRIFSREVEWRGTLKTFSMGSGGAYIKIEMQPIKVTVRDGSILEINELSISCSIKDEGCEGWSAKFIDKEVIFRTTLANLTRGYQPVVIIDKDPFKGHKTIEIEAYGAKFVKVGSE
mgnify:CR=1 FL=1